MRLLIVTGIFPPDIGGPATYVPVIATELWGRGHEVRVICLSDDASSQTQDYPFAVERILRRLPRGIRSVLTVLRILRRALDADVLFVNGLYLEAVCANVLLRKPLAMKIVGDWAWERAIMRDSSTVDFDAFANGGSDGKARFLSRLRTLCTRRADAVIVPSDYLARTIAHWGVSADRIRTIYNSSEPRSSLAPEAVPLQTPIKAVTVGRLVPWKHVDRTLRVIARIPEVGLVIVGDGPERERLETLAASLEVTSRVRFCGKKSQLEASALVSACDLLILNSTYEGFPHVALEAMSLSVPVIASAAGGTRELVQHGENGLLVRPLDDEALFEAVTLLASSPAARLRLASNAARTVERFGLRRMVAETEALLARVASRETPVGLAVRA